eukprot:1159188-Pelagomonas_calceolata.AAC.7
MHEWSTAVCLHTLYRSLHAAVLIPVLTYCATMMQDNIKHAWCTGMHYEVSRKDAVSLRPFGEPSLENRQNPSSGRDQSRLLRRLSP